MAYCVVMFDHCLYFNTTVLARLVEREWTVAFKPFGLTPPQGFILRSILATPGRSQYEIADALTISRPTATRLLHGLEKLGMIERRVLHADARHWAVFPTNQAVKMTADINAASAAVTRRIQKEIGKEKFDEAVRLVRSIGGALK
jgi:DNA-binding MarR family transcriptional regulator